MGTELELLIVDDDPDEKAIMRRYINRFRLARFNVTWSDGIEDALSLFEKREFDAVLMDYRLRTATAIDLIEKAPMRIRRTPIIIVTNYDDIGIDKEAYEYGVEFFINKNDINERVLERTIRYAMRNKELQNRLKDFSTILSHDLQSPLNSISSLIDVLLNPEIRKTEEEKAEFLKLISDESKHLRMLVSELGHYSGSDIIQLKFENVPLNELIDRALKLLRTEIDERDAVVEVGALPSVMADPNIIIHVFQNLIGNAIKYVNGARPQVKVSARCIDSTCRIEVVDNGIGIPEEEHERIFKPLVRLHARSEYVGTGLGLAICRQFVEKHKGRIWVESSSGGGSTFFVELPLAD